MRVAKLIVLLSFFLSYCKQTTFHRLSKDAIGGNYSIQRLKSKTGYTKLGGVFYTDESPKKIIPVGMTINGVLLQTDSGYFDFNVLPSSYTLTGGFIGRKWVLLEDLIIQEGDSIFIQFNMEVDNRPLH